MSEPSEQVAAIADTEPAPPTAATDSLLHTHLCPICHEKEECTDFCSTEYVDESEMPVGAAVECENCKNAPADSIDIFTGKVSLGDVLRCDEDGLVYEVTYLAPDDYRAELTSAVGYPAARRMMHLAIDGSPARRSMVDNKREPLWFRVKE